MASPANADQVSLLFTIAVQKESTQSQLWAAFNVVNVMDQHRSICPPADLAVPVVIPENGAGQRPPFGGDVKRVDIARSDQTEEPIQKGLSHKQQKKCLHQASRFAIHGTGTKAQAQKARY